MEQEPYRREVLLRRQRDGVLPLFPIWDDVRTFDGRPWRGRVDLISAGFPCQPFSVAGKQRASQDERNGWPDTIRIVREVGPVFVFLENVPGLLAGSHGYFGTVLRELAEAGFDAEWCVLGADDCGAPHRRKRLWVLAAHAERAGVRHAEQRVPQGRPTGGVPDEGRAQPVDDGQAGPVADADEGGWRGEREQEHSGQPGSPWLKPDGCGARGRGWWEDDPADLPDSDPVERPEREGQPEDDGEEQPSVAGAGGVGCGCAGELAEALTMWGLVRRLDRVSYGVAHRVDRLAAIGDGQVPCVAARAFHLLLGRLLVGEP